MPSLSEEDNFQEDLPEVSDDGQYELFTPVMQSINHDHLGAFAVKVRKSYEQTWNEVEALQKVEIESPIFGTCNVFYPVDFHDGTRWLFKFPMRGTRRWFSDMDSRALRSEALTMATIKQNTTIPMPSVFAFNDSCHNELACPYILMEYIEGKPLYSVWFDKTQPPEVIHARRTRCLEQLADAMIQLGQFTSARGGAMMYDQNLECSSVGSLRVPDYAAMFEHLHDEMGNDFPIYAEVGPFSEPQKVYTAILDRQEEPELETTDFDKGIRILLQMLLPRIPEPPEPTYRYPPFVLAHPDLDIENVIVSEDGSLKGVIGWEGIASNPRSIGNEQYPAWLTRDWNPAMYGWNQDMERGVKLPDGEWEDSPETLQRYRAIYAECMESYYSPSRRITGFYLTRNSLICQNLFLAANHHVCTYGVLKRILQEIANVVRKGLLNGDDDSSEEEDYQDGCDAEVTFDIFEVACALSDDKLSDRNVQLLVDGFDYLLSGKEVL